MPFRPFKCQWNQRSGRNEQFLKEKNLFLSFSIYTLLSVLLIDQSIKERLKKNHLLRNKASDDTNNLINWVIILFITIKWYRLVTFFSASLGKKAHIGGTEVIQPESAFFSTLVPVEFTFPSPEPTFLEQHKHRQLWIWFHAVQIKHPSLKTSFVWVNFAVEESCCDFLSVVEQNGEKLASGGVFCWCVC